MGFNVDVAVAGLLTELHAFDRRSPKRRGDLRSFSSGSASRRVKAGARETRAPRLQQLLQIAELHSLLQHDAPFFVADLEAEQR